jgi:transposase
MGAAAVAPLPLRTQAPQESETAALDSGKQSRLQFLLSWHGAGDVCGAAGLLMDGKGGDKDMPAPRRYSAELRERAVRMALSRGIPDTARELGIGYESLRRWVRNAETDGDGAGSGSVERERLSELERQVRELRETNERLRRRVTRQRSS